MHSSYTSQSGALIDNVCLCDAARRRGEDTRVDGGCGAVAHSALKTLTAAVQQEEISVVAFSLTRHLQYVCVRSASSSPGVQRVYVLFKSLHTDYIFVFYFNRVPVFSHLTHACKWFCYMSICLYCTGALSHFYGVFGLSGWIRHYTDFVQRSSQVIHCPLSHSLYLKILDIIAKSLLRIEC